MDRMHFGWPLLSLGSAAFFLLAGVQTPEPASVPHFETGRLILEYSASEAEAIVRCAADSDQVLERVELCAPNGATLFAVHGNGSLGPALSEFRLESQKCDLATLRQQFPAGYYELRARTDQGVYLRGRLELQHELPRVPVPIFPYEGATQVPTQGLVLSWFADPAVSGYEIQLEQDDNDGLSVKLPAGSNAFLVPDGFLESGRETRLELAARSASGNLTLTEVAFQTR